MFHHLLLLLPSLGIVRLVTGPLGTGKSYYGVRMAVSALRTGHIVVTNFDLVPDWIDQAVRRGHLRKRSSRLDAKVSEFERRYVRVHTMEELCALRVRPEPPFGQEIAPGRWQVKERSMVVILDEAHRWMNARDWKREGRGHLLDFFSLSRKRGMVIYLLSQRKENLDVQVRELFEDHIVLKNLKRSLRVLGLPLCPWNVFVAAWYNHAYEDECVRTDRYFLGWEKRLYDTMDTLSFSDGAPERGVTYLPLSRDQPDRQPAAPPAAPPAGPPAAQSPPAGPASQAVPTLEGDPTAPVELVDPSGL